MNRKRLGGWLLGPRVAWLFALAFISLAACSSNQRSPELRLYEFDCGRLEYESPEASGFGVRDDATAVRELFVPCYLIEHPEGRLLWDGGLSSAWAEEDGWVERAGWRLRLDRTLSDQLADINLTFDSLDYVAFSHMHFDHVGVANEIRGATLLIQEAESEAAFAEDVEVPGFDPSLYDGLKGLEWVVLNGDHDVFGDGTVQILALPGHTPGHQGLYVSLSEEGPVVLAGDLYHFRLSREQRIVPSFNVDADETLRSMDRLEGFLVEMSATLWIEHDLARYTERTPPDGYHH